MALQARGGRLRSLERGTSEHFYAPIPIDDKDPLKSTTDNLDAIQATMLNMFEEFKKDIEDLKTDVGKLEAFPVGSVFIAVDDRNPKDTLGYGNWTLTSNGRALVGAGDGKTLGQTGGARDIQLSEAHMPAHKHDVSVADFNGTRQTDVQGGVRQTDVQGAHSHTTTFQTAVNANYGEYVTRGDVNANTRSHQTDVQGAHSHSIDINHSHNVDISHSHSVGENVKGSNAAFNIENPYFVVNIWYRVS